MKKQPIYRKITSIILLLLCALIIYMISMGVWEYYNVELGGFALIALIIYWLYSIPLPIILIIYEGIVIKKKGVYWFSLTSGILFLLSWALMIIIPAIIA